MIGKYKKSFKTIQIKYPNRSWMAAKALFHALEKNAKVRTFHELMQFALQIGLKEITRNPSILQSRILEHIPLTYIDEDANLDPDICPHLTRAELKEARIMSNDNNPRLRERGLSLLFPETALARGFPDIHARFKHLFEERLDVFS